MKRISIITAALSAAVLFAPVPQALAASKFGVVPGDGPPVDMCRPGDRNKNCAPRVRDRHHHHGDTRFFFGFNYGWPSPYYYGNPYYDEDFGVANRMTCNYAEGLLERRGYRHVEATDCRGTRYGFVGIKNGHKYKISLNAYTGRYSRTRLS